MKRFLIMVLFLFMCLWFQGCQQQSESFGEVPEENAPRIPISALLFSPNEYIDKEVVIEGVIASECPTGGWIGVIDSSGHKIYVEMHGALFAPLPQRGGREVVVKGVVFQSEGATKEIKMLGKGVIIR